MITADGGYRRGAASALKPHVDEALAQCPDVRSVLVVRRTGQDVGWHGGPRRLVARHRGPPAEEHEAEAFDAEQPLYIMYTSGTTAKPKGILHTTGGYLVHAATTHRLVFDIKPETDVFWTAADIGWVTGHSYIVYGPLANGTTSVMYEGTPDAGGRDRWWRIVEDYGVTILYTAPTTIRTLMKWGEEYRRPTTSRASASSGRWASPSIPRPGCGTARTSGRDRCPIVDTWWQTETGGIMITPLPGITATKPGAAMAALPRRQRRGGRQRRRRRSATARVATWCITEPWPGMLRGIWGDPERYERRTGRGSRACTSPATGPRRTRTGTCGCSAGSTTS